MAKWRRGVAFGGGSVVTLPSANVEVWFAQAWMAKIRGKINKRECIDLYSAGQYNRKKVLIVIEISYIII